MPLSSTLVSSKATHHCILGSTKPGICHFLFKRQPPKCEVSLVSYDARRDAQALAGGGQQWFMGKEKLAAGPDVLHFPSSCSRLNKVPFLAFLMGRRNLMAETVIA